MTLRLCFLLERKIFGNDSENLYPFRDLILVDNMNVGLYVFPLGNI